MPTSTLVAPTLETQAQLVEARNSLMNYVQLNALLESVNASEASAVSQNSVAALTLHVEAALATARVHVLAAQHFFEEYADWINAQDQEQLTSVSPDAEATGAFAKLLNQNQGNLAEFGVNTMNSFLGSGSSATKFMESWEGPACAGIGASAALDGVMCVGGFGFHCILIWHDIKMATSHGCM